MVVESVSKKAKKTFTDLLRVRFKGILDPVGAALNRAGLTPDSVTLLGLAGNTVGACLLATGHITWGGILVLLMGPLDALDGTMARLRGVTSPFGAFLDSVTDRYSELIIYAGLMIYFLAHGGWLGAGLAYFAAAGSVLVSYVKARAQSLGFDSETGLRTRLERYIVLVPLLVVNLPVIALAVVAVLANFTALQRILYVRNQAQERKKLASGQENVVPPANLER